MQIYKLLAFAFLVMLLSCKENKKENPVRKTEFTGNIKHYVCQNNCENSGSDVQGNCKVCNNPLVHNQAFHDKDLLKNGPLNVPNYDGTKPKNTTNTAPAQNALGIYHYTCNNGCAGGSGSATNCSVCGELLVHNATYHNN